MQKKSLTRDNNRKCLFWVSYCVIILHAFYMICNTKGITSSEDMNKINEGDINSTWKMWTPLWWISHYSPSWYLHVRLNKACLRQPLCSFCCQCCADIVSHKMREDMLFIQTARCSINLWYFHVVKKCSLAISSVERKSRECVTMDYPHSDSIFSPHPLQQCLTWVNCLFRVPLANVFVLVVVCWICLPRKETVI